MTALLMHGDTERSAALRHEVPVAIGDPFLFAEVGGRPYVVTSSLEAARVQEALPEAEVVDYAELGFHELLQGEATRAEVELELAVRGVQRIGLHEAVVPGDFPLAVADRLRAEGITLLVDDRVVAERRRAKSTAELGGIARAQAAAEAGMAAAARLLRSADVHDGMLHHDGRPLEAETVRDALRAACAEHGASCPPDVIVASVWQGFGHEPGSGPLPASLPIQIDLWPRDEESACWADMTRTFVVGEVAEEHREELERQTELVARVLRETMAAIRPGVTGRELHAATCEAFEAAGYRTQRTGPGDVPEEGFQFALGHGIGLDLHEAPGLGQLGREPFVVGDVVAIEPGLWDRHVGGVRFEDLVLVTEDGCELLTEFPYDLAP